MSYGSLREQIVYPLRETAHMVSDADVIRVLKLARLEHLAETIEEFDTPYTLDWDKMLSPGEQQKMAFARLFYARPIFAGNGRAMSYFFLLLSSGLWLIAMVLILAIFFILLFPRYSLG